MNVNFLNGTAEQQGFVTEALSRLLHFDVGQINKTLNVSFVANPNPDVHNEYASAQALNTTTGEIKLRDDFPSFAPRSLLDTPEFAREVVVHELAHVLLGWMSSTFREQIAEMFGATTATWEAAAEWHDRPLEGIAETFKDAFLPPSLRQFFNRTNHKLPIRRYPEFRRMFRQAFAGGTEPTDPTWHPPVYLTGSSALGGGGNSFDDAESASPAVLGLFGAVAHLTHAFEDSYHDFLWYGSDQWPEPERVQLHAGETLQAAWQIAVVGGTANVRSLNKGRNDAENYKNYRYFSTLPHGIDQLEVGDTYVTHQELSIRPVWKVGAGGGSYAVGAPFERTRTYTWRVAETFEATDTVQWEVIEGTGPDIETGTFSVTIPASVYTFVGWLFGMCHEREVINVSHGHDHRFTIGSHLNHGLSAELVLPDFMEPGEPGGPGEFALPEPEIAPIDYASGQRRRDRPISGHRI